MYTDTTKERPMAYEFDNDSRLSDAIGPHVIYEEGDDAAEIEASLPEGYTGVDWSNQITRSDGRYAAPLLPRTNTKFTPTRVVASARASRELAHDVAAIVGDDGTGDLRVIVDCALADDPHVTVDEIVEIVREARADAATEVAS